MNRIEQLRWRCRRGMRELDLLLSGFVDTDECTLQSDEEAQAFQRLLDYQDDMLMELLMGRTASRDEGIASIIDKIQKAAVHKS